jgi:hypothetical protein
MGSGWDREPRLRPCHEIKDSKNPSRFLQEVDSHKRHAWLRVNVGGAGGESVLGDFVVEPDVGLEHHLFRVAGKKSPSQDA